MADQKTILPHQKVLSKREQLGGFALGLALSILIVATAILFARLAPEESHAEAVVAIRWACVGGFMGGVVRALFMLIWELGGRAGGQASLYLSKWFLYLFKPFVGIGGGLFLFLLVNLGVVGLFAGAGPELSYLRVLLTSITGGFFFEDVFALLRRMVPKEQ